MIYRSHHVPQSENGSDCGIVNVSEILTVYDVGLYEWEMWSDVENESGLFFDAIQKKLTNFCN